MPNLLAGETSPYLLQHAHQPVDWQPWNADTLAEARRQDKPILLSIGYSACHWCHVMAHESFDDPDIGALMNRLFINIKVDREERPDLDQIYQHAHAVLSQQTGGWPLTVFLAPDGTPFFSGTYFPKRARYGLPGFGELLARIGEAWRTQRDTITQQNVQLRNALARPATPPLAIGTALDERPLIRAREQLADSYDLNFGGFGRAPKFPHQAELAFLLRRAVTVGDDIADEMAVMTLQRMAEGGLYDQLGGGFARYSVDAQWDIPHFEKMLSDNALLLRLYADAFAHSGEPLFARVVEETAAWVIREMQAPDGGYYTALDADSEGEEGRFYVWTPDQVRAVLGDATEFDIVAAHYGLDGPANFEHDHWHLRISQPLEYVAAALGLSLETARAHLSTARAKLFAARETRPRPACDDKCLTSWNALMIGAMTRASAVFRRPDWLASARRALEALQRTHWQGDRLLATSRNGAAHLNAYLDDHAFLLQALLDLLEADPLAVDLARAQTLADTLLTHFEDREGGGFFFTRHDHETLLQRPKTGNDTALPSGNGIAALALQKLSMWVGEPRFEQAAERVLRYFAPTLRDYPATHTSLLIAQEVFLSPPEMLILTGPDGASADWAARLRACYAPNRLMLALPADASGFPESLRKPQGLHVNAWLCRGVNCLAPISAWDDLMLALTPPHARNGCVR